MTLSKEKSLRNSDSTETGLSGHNVENFPAFNGVRVIAEKFLNSSISVRCTEQLGDFSVELL